MTFYSTNIDKKIFHKELIRQLKKLFDDDDETSVEDYLRNKVNQIKSDNSVREKEEVISLVLNIMNHVNDTYEQFDKNLILKSRTVERNSDELSKLNNKLVKNNLHITNSIINLKGSVKELLNEKGQSEISVDDFELEDLSVLIKNLITKNKLAEKKLKRTNKKLKVQSIEIEKKNQNILSGIEYAKRIQDTILNETGAFQKIVPNSFVLNLPKEIVSGDFFWFHKSDSKIILAVADCTGHGVPGAFMSIISNMVLNEIVVDAKVNEPSEILKILHKRISQIFKLDAENAQSQDGLDIAVCVINTENDVLEFAGANRPMYLIRKNELTILKGVARSIGGFKPDKQQKFLTQEISLENEDVLYLFTDGYIDQFGGDESLKFSSKKFQQQLLNNVSKSANEQLLSLQETHLQWKNNEQQVDDILVVGMHYEIHE